MNLLAEACDTIVDPRDPQIHNQEYHTHLIKLERKLEILPVVSTSTESQTGITPSAEVYKLVTRIYLARSSQRPWETPETLDALVDQAFTIPEEGHFCEHFFPLFILACEARTDERRACILGLMERNERADRGRSINGLREGIQAIWIQQDLHADSDLLVNYFELLSNVISSSNTFPSFA